MLQQQWHAWIRPTDAGLKVVGVRPDGTPEWTGIDAVPTHVAEYLELRDTLIDPALLRTVEELRGVTTLTTAPLPAHDGDVLISFEVAYREPPERTDTVSVDLRWSLWTTEQDTWDERSPGTWERMRSAFAGEAPTLLVYTSPHKEIRFGTVTIRKGQAEVSFKAGWDDIHDLMDTHGLDSDDEELRAAVTSYFAEGDGFDESGDTVGAQTSKDVETETFRGLMQAIDEVELHLIDVETENGAHFEAFCRALKTGEDPEVILEQADIERETREILAAHTAGQHTDAANDGCGLCATALPVGPCFDCAEPVAREQNYGTDSIAVLCADCATNRQEG